MFDALRSANHSLQRRLPRPANPLPSTPRQAPTHASWAGSGGSCRTAPVTSARMRAGLVEMVASCAPAKHCSFLHTGSRLRRRFRMQASPRTPLQMPAACTDAQRGTPPGPLLPPSPTATAEAGAS